MEINKKSKEQFKKDFLKAISALEKKYEWTIRVNNVSVNNSDMSMFRGKDITGKLAIIKIN